MDIAALRAQVDVDALRRRTGGHGPWRRVDVVGETGSTNSDLVDRARRGESVDGAVLVADYQNQGRGRHGRSWSAPARSQLSVSVGVDASAVPVDGWGWLPLLCGVAVTDVLHDLTGIDAKLKWPNDVLADGHKLAGILAEVATSAATVIVGIGLNVTLTHDELPVPTATSLLLLDSPVLDRTVLLSSLLQALATRIGGWQAAHGADAALVEAYRRCSATLGQRVRVDLPGGEEVVGRAIDLDESGRLIVDVGHRCVPLAAGDVTHLRPVDA
ncbi:biotin--[acetyl-CoA-carboxylase] ligase [Mycolicibacterium sp. S2-37]|uniref:biotin--[acetyl-CoA-carboxylase] ligase n=1 Tax=Mycolicibacterium sp. S2-37 TaxID=2810297 RepID=UPI001A948101|nr:biotin--[acetyl-CoA-carboxylase] ligase [Mycolicibacterium sp. S2-37]MBO0677694.1 biotin--[acetyl-CoA-carboxylase] ligase [Mycolicibacterium sp. S2-37]